MRVGLDLLFLVPGETGGTEVYARELAPRLAAAGAEVVAFVGREARGAGVAPGAREVVLPARTRDRRQWVLAEQLLLPGAARRAGCDVVHGLANTAPLHGRFARVVTVHDVTFASHPESLGAVNAAGLRGLVGAAVRRSHLVLTDTPGGAGRLRDALAVRAPVVPVPLGVAAPAVAPEPAAAVRRALGLGNRPVLLCTTGRRPHKNVAALVEALARLDPPRPALVATGYPTAHDAALLERARALGVAGDVVLTPWLAAARLEGLYALAAGCVVPSLDEGFGLPLLEAMVRGVPVAHSGGGALAEVAGDAALRFDPRDPVDMAAALRRLLGDAALRGELVAAGRARAAELSWSATAERTLAAYEQAIAVAGGRRAGTRL